MNSLPFVEEILADLRRFKECVEDNQDVDLDRDRFDLLAQLGLLERTQRSPALWVMTKAGEDAIAQPAAGEPVAWECYEPASEWNGYKGRDYLSREKPKGCSVRAVPLGRIAAPPAAAHGDDTRRIDWLACKWRLGGKLPDVDHGSFREAIDAAMRAQGDGGEA